LEDLKGGAASQSSYLANSGAADSTGLLEDSADQRWNPLDGIGRNWMETVQERVRRPVPAGQPGRPRGLLDGGDQVPASLRPGDFSAVTGDSFAMAGGQPSPLLPSSSYAAAEGAGGVEGQLSAAQSRAEALKARISQLETELGGPPAGAAGVGGPHQDVYLRISVPQPLDGGKLGLAVKDLCVASVTDPRALQFGWAVGDRILAVNDQPISTTHEFTQELSKAMSAFMAIGRPLVFEVVRAAGYAGAAAGSLVAQAPPPAQQGIANGYIGHGESRLDAMQHAVQASFAVGGYGSAPVAASFAVGGYAAPAPAAASFAVNGYAAPAPAAASFAVAPSTRPLSFAAGPAGAWMGAPGVVYTAVAPAVPYVVVPRSAAPAPAGASVGACTTVLRPPASAAQVSLAVRRHRFAC